ncbi:MAG: rhodanese-like domain-containing protein [Verrucomicrobiota bacterium]
MNRFLFSLSFLCVSATASFGQGTAAPGKPAGVVVTDKVKHVTPNELEPLLAQKKVVVLDLRTPEEFASGHIAGARNIDFNGADFKEKIGALDKSQSYVVHCAAGGRSTRSLPVFDEQQFKSILHLDGGLKAWTAAGKPIGQ